jgi:hypothetical protein
MNIEEGRPLGEESGAPQSKQDQHTTYHKVHSGTVLVPLSSGGQAVVDSAVAELLRGHVWSESPQGYAVAKIRRHGRQATLFMHRVIMGLAHGDFRHVDHVNHDKLDNRLSNLRLATNAQNQHNQVPRTGASSAFKGVVWHRRDKRWIARIHVQSKAIVLGRFTDEIAAALAYDAAARRHFGEFAYLNFPEEATS